MFIVQRGEATIVYGGTIEDARDTGNGEIRAPRHGDGDLRPFHRGSQSGWHDPRTTAVAIVAIGL